MKLILVCAFLSAPVWGATCDSLASLALPNTTITLAQSVAAGEFTPPGRTFGGTPAPAVALKDLPAFCRIAATLKPTNDSDIKIEVWLPAVGMERKIPSSRQRRMGRRHQLRRAWPRRCTMDTRRLPPTPATWAAAAVSRSGIRKR